MGAADWHGVASWVESVVLDIRHAIRLWRGSPGFAITSVAVLGLGIGATTALFGQINAVFWRPLPVSRPAELRLLAWTSARPAFVGGPNVLPGPRLDGTETLGSFSFGAYAAMRDGNRTFTDLACWADLGEARPVILGELGFGSIHFVSGNYFRTLGVRAALGRAIEPVDDESPRSWSPVAVISHRFWQRAFGGDPNVTSRTIGLNGRTFSVVGVLPQGFSGVDLSVSPDVIAPIGAVQVAAASANPLQNPRVWNACRVIGRLAPGVQEEAARADLERWVAQAIAATPPQEPYDPPRMRILDGSRGLESLREASATPLAVLFAVVGGLLLAACANIAGLLLTQANARRKEIATRLALGGSRRRLVRQLVTESLLLSLAGGVVGVALARLLAASGGRLLSRFMPTLFGGDRVLDVQAPLDARVLAFAGATVLLTGLACGVAPALTATRVGLMAVIKDSAAASWNVRRGVSGAQVMVAAQSALSIALLVGAGLFLRTVDNLRAADLGFHLDGVLYARVEPRSGGMRPEERQQYFEAAVKHVARLPGVVAASAAAAPVMGDLVVVGGRSETWPFCVPEWVAAGMPDGRAAIKSVLPGYFAAMRMPIRSGRDLTWADNTEQARVSVVVNDVFARKYFPQRSVLGRALGLQCPQAPDALAVVGVVDDGRQSPRRDAEPSIYLPLLGDPRPITIVLRTSTDPRAMIPTVRRSLRELNASIPTFNEATLVDLREQGLRRERLLASLLTFFGSVTLVVCCLGLYGMLSYGVARRRSEIGVRMTVGARAGHIMCGVLRESLLPVFVGIVAGCVLLLVLVRPVESLLFDVSISDPAAMAAAVLVFVLVAAIATAIPVRAALRVDPALVLRQP